MIELLQLQDYNYAAKTGGTTGANFDAWENGAIGDMESGKLPRPRILPPSAPGKILPYFKTRGLPISFISGEGVSSGGILVPRHITEQAVPKSEKLTHHAAWAQEALRRGDRVGFDKNFDAIAERFLEIAQSAILTGLRYNSH